MLLCPILSETSVPERGPTEQFALVEPPNPPIEVSMQNKNQSIAGFCGSYTTKCSVGQQGMRSTGMNRVLANLAIMSRNSREREKEGFLSSFFLSFMLDRVVTSHKMLTMREPTDGAGENRRKNESMFFLPAARVTRVVKSSSCIGV